MLPSSEGSDGSVLVLFHVPAPVECVCGVWTDSLSHVASAAALSLSILAPVGVRATTNVPPGVVRPGVPAPLNPCIPLMMS